ncbi:hydroxyacylglutathione hydrolase [Catenovulum agarivorans DS-2]|uniref:Hydroxyacylglutathione hydrolase n=1 Tax=Catenovulum agarivorans DS-2 TaxID=1328313 RepID=W7QSW0_9ALTE|nr:hydroxyacylglutathione hydrolase [Catenovulum agarivorans]EWH12102.1 hydroxyacylglutathione hydrolase [Catenovulum agarivorans DS-2]
MLIVEPIKALSDNYIWHIHNHEFSIVVDPGDAEVVQQAIDGKSLVAILITHHHWDHTNGVAELKQQYPDIPVYGPNNSPFELIDEKLSEGDTVSFQQLGIKFNIIEIPGHTLDHIAYINSDSVFCGDTLFSIGCGRMFEGTPEMFNLSLNKLKLLPDETKVYCTHEYTQSNIAFARSLEPNNQALVEYQTQVNQWRQQGLPSLPTTIGREKALNPFLKADDPNMQQRLSDLVRQQVSQPVSAFAALRKLKDTF